MRGDSCVLFPVVNGKPSMLYTELYNLTNRDRKLTNLLYALSQQDEIKGMFAHSDLNSQGEPLTQVFMTKLEVKEILDEKAQIKTEAVALKAIDRRGKRIYYDDTMTIVQDVLNFNESHDKLKASIKHNEQGFYIEVETINSENYNVNNFLNTRLALQTDFLQHLANSGLNTNLNYSRQVFNPLNIYYIINQLKAMKRGTDNINVNVSSLLVDLFSGDALMARLISQLGDDLPQAISQVSGYDYGNNNISLTSMQETQISNMLNKIQTSMKRVMNTAVIDQLIENSNAAVPQQETYMNTDSMSIRDTLKELYTLYHLDQEHLDNLNRKVKTISDAANKLFQIRIALYNEQKLKHEAVRGEKRLMKIQRDIDQEEYLVGITNMLKDILKGISTHEAKLKRLHKKLEQNPDSLEVIRRLSNIILGQLDTVAAYSDICKQLANNDLLENDDSTGNNTLLKDIKDIAKEISTTLDRIETNARTKQIDVVKAFLNIYWGEDKTLSDGTVVTIDTIMQKATKDPNFFDRFLYAVNTSSDEMMGLIAQAVKEANNKRDAVLMEQLKNVRSITKPLYDSGSNTAFMFERNEEGYPSTKLISDYDYARFDREFKEYKEQIRNDANIDKSEYTDLENTWRQKHSKTIRFSYTDSNGAPQKLALTVPIYDAPVSVKDRLTTAQYTYWKKMMDLKAEMISKMDAVSNNTLFDVIEVSNDTTTALAQTGGNPVEAYKVVKNKILDLLKDREDDTEYGSILDANNLKLVHLNFRGEQINTLPIFYTHEIKDRSRVSTDFSRSMIAFLAASQQYVQMDKILDALLLAKDFMLTQRRVEQSSGGSTLADIQRLGKKAYVNVATKAGIATNLGGLADDFFERAVYSKSRKDEGYLYGTKIRIDKLVDAVTGYTSITGLAVNTLGAEANLLVGKLQMLIESGLGFGGEFFNMKDLVYSDAKYFQMLPELLNEVSSNNKSSLLGLMMQRFDVLDDFYEKIKETGFYKSPISKIIGNRSLFFLYGIGEHLLHAQGMIAVLHNKRNNILDDKGNEVCMLEAFDVVKDAEGNGTLVIKQGYTNKDGSAITEEQINKLKKRISYVNRSMHGAFGIFEKGMIHRYAVGRLIMNFRQWMPAHYSRRFRGRYYDADLGEFREGYYVSTFKFIRECVRDMKNAKLQIGTRWDNLSDMERYNMKRAFAETAILAMLTASIALLGDYKDKKGNWAYRHLIYELKRLEMETMASNPIAAYGFVSNMIKILNSPAAALNTAEKLSHLLKLTDLFVTIESGKYEGENKYIHNLEKDLPFYGQIVKMLDLGESDDLFMLFN